MAELDSLLGSRISLISQQDVRYDGILFSINANESSLVLRDVKSFGTEERTTDKFIPPSTNVIPYVSFPGAEIKDLFVHESNEVPPAATATSKQTTSSQPQASLPPPPSSSHVAPPPVPSATSTNMSGHKSESSRDVDQVEKKENYNNFQRGKPHQRNSAGVGTGEHLLRLKIRRDHPNASNASTNNATNVKAAGEFDFMSNLQSFNKAEVLAKVAEESTNSANPPIVVGHYEKDDFFDTLSCDVLDGENNRRTRMTPSEERALNQDTFGAYAVQKRYYNYHHRGGRGGGGHGQYHHRGGGRGGNYGGRSSGYQRRDQESHDEGKGLAGTGGVGHSTGGRGYHRGSGGRGNSNGYNGGRQHNNSNQHHQHQQHQQGHGGRGRGGSGRGNNNNNSNSGHKEVSVNA